MRHVRFILWGLVAVALIGLGALYFMNPGEAESPVQFEYAENFGKPFTLTDGSGQRFDSASLDGTPYALFFGFTACPDVCPTTLSELTRLRRAVDGDFKIVFVTVDPERDGVEEVGAYADLFGTPIIGLTGTADEIEAVKAQFGAYSEKVDVEGGDYTINHTANVFLIGADGKFQSTLAPEESFEARQAKIERLVG